MTLHLIDVKVDRFKILSKKPNAWQLILPNDMIVNRDDQILIREVDSFGMSTGNEKKGIVFFIDSGVDTTFLNFHKLYYICPVLVGVGDLTIGGTFVIN